MQKANGKKGYSLGRRLVLVGVLLAFMVLLPLFWHPAEEIMQSETAGLNELSTPPVKPVATPVPTVPKALRRKSSRGEHPRRPFGSLRDKTVAFGN